MCIKFLGKLGYLLPFWQSITSSTSILINNWRSRILRNRFFSNFILLLDKNIYLLIVWFLRSYCQDSVSSRTTKEVLIPDSEEGPMDTCFWDLTEASPHVWLDSSVSVGRGLLSLSIWPPFWTDLRTAAPLCLCPHCRLGGMGRQLVSDVTFTQGRSSGLRSCT